MKKELFIKELSKRIQHLSQEERMDILNYYGELIDDRIEAGESEQSVIDGLGTIDYIIFNLYDVRKNSEAAAHHETKVDYSARPIPNASVKTEKNVQHTYKEKGVRHENGERKVSWVKVVLLILCAPIIFGLFSGLIGLAVGLTAGFVGACVGVFSLPLAGIYAIFGAIVHIGVNTYTGLLQLGVGIMVFSLGILLIKLFFKIIKYIWKFFAKCIKWVAHLFGKGGNLIYE